MDQPSDFPFLEQGEIPDFPPEDPQAGRIVVNHGELSCYVWPPYIGLAAGDPGPGPVAAGEPFDDLNYNRGMIAWRTLDNGDIVGAAQVFLPKGVYSHIVFFSGPGHEHALMGANQLEHPVVFDRPGIIDIDPIRNTDHLPRLPA